MEVRKVGFSGEKRLSGLELKNQEPIRKNKIGGVERTKVLEFC